MKVELNKTIILFTSYSLVNSTNEVIEIEEDILEATSYVMFWLIMKKAKSFRNYCNGLKLRTKLVILYFGKAFK